MLYLLNILTQLVMLKSFLGPQGNDYEFFFHGWIVIAELISRGRWFQSVAFPIQTICHVSGKATPEGNRLRQLPI